MADTPEEERAAAVERFARDVDGAQRPVPAPDAGADGGAGSASAREPPGGAPGVPSPAAGRSRQQACAHVCSQNRQSSRGCFIVSVCQGMALLRNTYYRPG